MRLSVCICMALLLPASCAPNSGFNIAPGGASIGHWVSFYTRKLEAERLDYFYDQSRVRRSSDHVVARWKIVGSPSISTTLYIIDISCRDGTFTEKGTVVVDAEGAAKEMPQAERYVDRPIETGSSSDVFRKLYCR